MFFDRIGQANGPSRHLNVQPHLKRTIASIGYCKSTQLRTQAASFLPYEFHFEIYVARLGTLHKRSLKIPTAKYLELMPTASGDQPQMGLPTCRTYMYLR